MVILWWWWQWYWKWWGGLTCSRAWECLAPVLAREWQTKSCPEIKFNAKFCICLWVIIKFIRVKTVSFRKPYHHHLGVVWRNIRTLTSAISPSSRLLAIHWPGHHMIFESLLKVGCQVVNIPGFWPSRSINIGTILTTICTTIFTTVVIRSTFTTNFMTIGIRTIFTSLDFSPNLLTPWWRHQHQKAEFYVKANYKEGLFGLCKSIQRAAKCFIPGSYWSWIKF